MSRRTQSGANMYVNTYLFTYFYTHNILLHIHILCIDTYINVYLHRLHMERPVDRDRQRDPIS